MKHTPGPWVAPKEQGNLILPKRNWEDQQIGAIANGMQILVYPCDTMETEANARLIAAAPDLLEACKWAHQFLVSRKDIPPVGEAAQIFDLIAAAIAKAEGK